MNRTFAVLIVLVLAVTAPTATLAGGRVGIFKSLGKSISLWWKGTNKGPLVVGGTHYMRHKMEQDRRQREIQRRYHKRY